MVSGNNWLKHGEMLLLQAKCDGSPPFLGCIQYKNKLYNITNKENCSDDDTQLSSNICDFPLSRYYNDPGEYTIVVIVQNEVTKKISPVTINVYKGEKNISSDNYFIICFILTKKLENNKLHLKVESIKIIEIHLIFDETI